MIPRPSSPDVFHYMNGHPKLIHNLFSAARFHGSYLPDYVFGYRGAVMRRSLFVNNQPSSECMTNIVTIVTPLQIFQAVIRLDSVLMIDLREPHWIFKKS